MIAQDTIRHYLPTDYQAMADLANASNAFLKIDSRLSAEEIRSYCESPEFDPIHDSFILERAGQMIAMSDVEFSKATGRAWVDGVVHPDHWGEGLGRRLIDWSEARVLARAEAEVASDQPVSLQRHTTDQNPAAIHLFERAGYAHIRPFYQMRIEFGGRIEPTPLPDGIELRPFDRAQHAQAVFEAQQESFADHWGFEPGTFEEWAHYFLDYNGQDFSMWMIAWDGDEIAGISINRLDETDDQMGWVSTLGVRRRWRKQGLGLALLQQSFALFQDRGYQRAGLGVDASSLTNAVALYERAGMHVHNRTLAYRRLLRGAELAD